MRFASTALTASCVGDSSVKAIMAGALMALATSAGAGANGILPEKPARQYTNLRR